MSVKISGEKYAMMYGPTTGDKVRLADTNLIIEVEKDFTIYERNVNLAVEKRFVMGWDSLLRRQVRTEIWI